MSWQDLSGTHCDAQGCVLDFGDSHAEKQTALAGELVCAPLDLAIIDVSGADAMQLLQGQLTCDVKEVSDTQSRLGAWCTPKGRITVLFRLYKQGDSYRLIVPQFQLEYCLKRLQMFVFRSDVTLKGLDAKVVGYSGLDLDLSTDEVKSQDNGLYIRLAGSRLFYCVSPAESAWQQNDAKAIGTQAWQLLTIEAGLSQISEPTVDAFIPQMLHLPALNAVSFTKGCYTGQEVVARTHYLGKVKRQLYRAHSQGACPAAGAELFSTEDTRGQSAGLVVQAQAHPDGGCRLLLVAQDKLITADAVRLHSSEGDSLNILDLPYNTEAS